MVRKTADDQSEQKVLDDIETFGWHCVHIMAEGEFPEYSFTVGLFHTYEHPELIIFGLHSEVAHKFSLPWQTLRSPVNLSTFRGLPMSCLVTARVASSKSRRHNFTSTWASAAGTIKATAFHCTKSFGHHALGSFPGTLRRPRSSVLCSRSLANSLLAPNYSLKRTAAGRLR
jgi:hypothetical protein